MNSIQVCTINVFFLGSMFSRFFLSAMLLKGNIKELEKNQSNCALTRHASLITYFNGYSATSALSKLPDKPVSRETINRCIKKPGDWISDASIKFW